MPSQLEIAKIHTKAIQETSIRYVVNLNSIGAQLEKGAGPVNGVYDFEQQGSGLHVKYLRPAYFYYNLFNQFSLIRQGVMEAKILSIPVASRSSPE